MFQYLSQLKLIDKKKSSIMFIINPAQENRQFNKEKKSLLFRELGKVGVFWVLLKGAAWIFKPKK
ncbi:hypothetical protein pb186bvf_020105 [Paramecium bursaria]